MRPESYSRPSPLYESARPAEPARISVLSLPGVAGHARHVLRRHALGAGFAAVLAAAVLLWNVASWLLESWQLR